MLFDQKADSADHANGSERCADGTKHAVKSLGQTMTLANRKREATMDASPTKMSDLAYQAALQIDMLMAHEVEEAPAVVLLASRLHVPPVSELQQRSFAGVSALGDATRAWYSMGDRAAFTSWANFIDSFGDFVGTLRGLSASTEEEKLLEAMRFCQALSKQALAYERGVEVEHNYAIFDRSFGT